MQTHIIERAKRFNVSILIKSMFSDELNFIELNLKFN